MRAVSWWIDTVESAVYSSILPSIVALGTPRRWTIRGRCS